MPKHTIKVTKDLCRDRAIWHAPLLCDGRWMLHTGRVDVVARWPALKELMQGPLGQIGDWQGRPVAMRNEWRDITGWLQIALTFACDDTTYDGYPVKLYQPSGRDWGVALDATCVSAFAPDRLMLAAKTVVHDYGPAVMFSGKHKRPFGVIMAMRSPTGTWKL